MLSVISALCALSVLLYRWLYLGDINTELIQENICKITWRPCLFLLFSVQTWWGPAELLHFWDLWQLEQASRQPGRTCSPLAWPWMLESSLLWTLPRFKRDWLLHYTTFNLLLDFRDQLNMLKCKTFSNEICFQKSQFAKVFFEFYFFWFYTPVFLGEYCFDIPHYLFLVCCVLHKK